MAKLMMSKELLLVALVVLGVVWGEVKSCNSCGSECQSACGTRHFRTCCFNYLKKRSPSVDPLPLNLDPSLRLELWLAKSRSNPYLQRSMFESSVETPFPQEFSDNRNEVK